MLSEEALIFLGGLAALGLVALGVLELLWPTRSPHPARLPAKSEAGLPPATAASPSRLRRWRSRRPRHALNGAGSPYRRRESKETGAVDLGTAFEEEPVTPAPVLEPAIDVAGAADRCFALYEAGEYAAVVGAATGAIAASTAFRRGDVARLWSILALAHEAMDDRTSARAALESAIAAAPLGERAAYEQQLAALALRVAETLLARGDGVRGPESEEDLGLLRETLDWLARGGTLAPGDAKFRELLDDVERRLWPGYERVVMTLIQRQQYPAARRLLGEALDDPRCPDARVETFRELFSGTFGGEIGQLTAQAIRSMQDARETEALGALERAEELLETVHDEALPPKRREEVDRRLWWGYKKLGRRRAQAGEYEAAADALSHALRFAGVGTDRQAETRGALVRALEGLVEQRVLVVRELAEAGDREAALVEIDALWTRLRRAVGDGLAEGDLAVAFAAAQRAFDEVDARP